MQTVNSSQLVCNGTLVRSLNCSLYVVEEDKVLSASEINGLFITYKPTSSDEELTIKLMIVKEKEDEATVGKEWLLSLKKVCK